MADSRSGGIVVLGLGNPVLGDDAVGLHVVEALESMLAVDPIPGVNVKASTRAGFELLDILHDFRVALILDAYQSADAIPGQLRQLTLEKIAGCSRLVGQHELSLPSAFSFAKRLGVAMPEHVEIYTVETTAADILSEALTPAVADAVVPLARMLYGRLGELSSLYTITGDMPAAGRAFYDPRG